MVGDSKYLRVNWELAVESFMVINLESNRSSRNVEPHFSFSKIFIPRQIFDSFLVNTFWRYVQFVSLSLHFLIKCSLTSYYVVVFLVMDLSTLDVALCSMYNVLMIPSLQDVVVCFLQRNVANLHKFYGEIWWKTVFRIETWNYCHIFS